MKCIDSCHLSLLRHSSKKDQKITPPSCQKGVWGLGGRAAGEKDERCFFLRGAKMNGAISHL